MPMDSDINEQFGKRHNTFMSQLGILKKSVEKIDHVDKKPQELNYAKILELTIQIQKKEKEFENL